MDADHRGGSTQFFGGKASEPESSKKRNFTYPTCTWRPRWGISSECRRDLLHHKTMRPWAIVQRSLRDSMFSRFGTNPTCDRRTDRHVMTANTALA